MNRSVQYKNRHSRSSPIPKAIPSAQSPTSAFTRTSTSLNPRKSFLDANSEVISSLAGLLTHQVEGAVKADGKGPTNRVCRSVRGRTKR